MVSQEKASLPPDRRALIIEDDPSCSRSLAAWLAEHGLDCTTDATLETARRRIEGESFDLAIVDLFLPDGQGTELLPQLQRTHTVLLTGSPDVESAVHSLRSGAIDYLTKPVDLDRLKRIIANLPCLLPTSKIPPRIEKNRLGHLVGRSRPMKEVFQWIQRVAPTNTNVFLLGETGTGKELAALTLHEMSDRANGPFVAVNCGALPRELIESELFGHTKGAFTGAARRHAGVFERAHGGTLFLDEITECPTHLQTRLLRILETHTVRPIGGETDKPIDVRIVAACNRDPWKAVEEGYLRSDLLYRLFVFPIELPPLHRRTGDVALLAQHFLEQFNAAYGQQKEFAPELVESLEDQTWPGNVRELRNHVERLFVLADDVLRPEHLEASPGHSLAEESDRVVLRVGESIEDAERRLIFATLERTDGNKAEAARMLGISLGTLYRRLNAYR